MFLLIASVIVCDSTYVTAHRVWACVRPCVRACPCVHLSSSSIRDSCLHPSIFMGVLEIIRSWPYACLTNSFLTGLPLQPQLASL